MSELQMCGWLMGEQQKCGWRLMGVLQRCGWRLTCQLADKAAAALRSKRLVL